jgi:TPP-dependent pyruvate/acetoin dehydrogenase alpha subunit
MSRRVKRLSGREAGHNIGDPGTWRPKEEVEAWKARDPIARHRKRILDEEVANSEQLDTIDAEEQARMDAAIAAAEAAPKPDVSEALNGLYVDEQLGRMALQGVRS